MGVDPAPQAVQDDQIEKKNEKDAESVAAKSADAEALEPEPKAYYSRLSVWLMILFSGLAIGSDG